MTNTGWGQILIFFIVLILLVKPLGTYLARVYSGERTLLSPLLVKLESGMYRLAGIHPEEEMGWKKYGLTLLSLSLVSIIFLYALLRLQHLLPLNPMGFGPVAPDLALNTAVSFVSNTNWQAYGGETTMSYLTQMLGLTVQNFVSAATGMAVLVALIRGFARHQAKSIGNFWVDLIRGILYILLPLSVLVAFLLTASGSVQTLAPNVTAHLLQGDGEQAIALGPAASQIAIKQLGTNGGGFFNANSAHPFENSTPFSNLVEMLSILLIPAALTYTFGRMVGNTRQGWTILAAMLILLIVFVGFAYAAEAAPNQALGELGIRPASQRPKCWWEYGRKGNPLWRGQLGTLGDCDNGRFQRFSELHA